MCMHNREHTKTWYVQVLTKKHELKFIRIQVKDA